MLWLPTSLSCDMDEKNYFYCEAFLSYGDLKRRGHRYSVVFGTVGNKVSHNLFHTSRLVIMVSAISQLRVLASNKTNFESVAQGA